MLAVGIGIVIHIANDSASNAERTKRASQLGTGLGTIMCVGLAPIWLPFAYQYGKKKREEREKAAAKSKRKKRR